MFNEHPDYYAYLVHILVYLKKEDTNTRLVAGIQLKNNIKNQFNTIHLLTLDYIKEACISALLEPDSDPLIHKSISSVISAIVRRGQVHNWIDVILLLIKNIDDVSQPHVSKVSKHAHTLKKGEKERKKNCLHLLLDFIGYTGNDL